MSVSEALDIENYGIVGDCNYYGDPRRVTGYLGSYAPHYSGINIAPDMVKKVNEMCVKNAKRKRRKERIKKFFIELFDKLFIPEFIALFAIAISAFLAFILF